MERQDVDPARQQSQGGREDHGHDLPVSARHRVVHQPDRRRDHPQRGGVRTAAGARASAGRRGRRRAGEQPRAPAGSQRHLQPHRHPRDGAQRDRHPRRGGDRARHAGPGGLPEELPRGRACEARGRRRGALQRRGHPGALQADAENRRRGHRPHGQAAGGERGARRGDARPGARAPGARVRGRAGDAGRHHALRPRPRRGPDRRGHHAHDAPRPQVRAGRGAALAGHVLQHP